MTFSYVHETSISEPTIKVSTRIRRVSDLFQYERLGHPILKSIQSLFHSLATSLTPLLEDVNPPDNTQQLVQGRTWNHYYSAERGFSQLAWGHGRDCSCCG
ncbi:hypothetical protein XENOCAPTIV_023551 [Xenoophorus captivus]|uniref:Uncharacterized protein n=1 Tax=Xenoophorus captivus TaxID=1517983 RepID=A0ABV0SB33_9TELE